MIDNDTLDSGRERLTEVQQAESARHAEALKATVPSATGQQITLSANRIALGTSDIDAEIKRLRRLPSRRRPEGD